MARKAPTGPPAWIPGWVYTVHLDPPYPTPPCENGHQVGHYTGISRNGLRNRLTTHAEGGPGAARLLQVQKAAGGTFHLVSVEWGTQDLETARKYCGAARRCSHCKAASPGPGEPAAEPGWVGIVHLDPPARQATRPGPEEWQPGHRAVFIAGAESIYTALGRAGRDIALVAQMPEAHGGSWRLVAAEWAAAGRAAWLTERRAAFACPVCRAAKEQARADELLAAIERREVADRYFPLARSWAARWHTRHGQPVVFSGPGGHLGRNVTRIADALVRRELAERSGGPPAGATEWQPGCARTGCGARMRGTGWYFPPGAAMTDEHEHQPAGRPYLITRAGQAVLRRARAPRRSAQRWRRPGIPAARIALVRRLRAAGLPLTRDGRLWLARMTDQQRDKAGVMTRAMAREHRALRAHHHPRRAERIRGLAPLDQWTTPGPAPVPATSAARRIARPPGGADPSWPLNVGDGIAAAGRQGRGGARPAASSRRPATSIARGGTR